MDEFEGAMAVAEATEEAAEKKAVDKKAPGANDKVSYDVDLDYNMEWEVESEPAEEETEEEVYYEPRAPRAARAINKHLFVWVFNFVCGLYGVDRFVRGQIAMGVFKILTFGGFGFWYLTDLIIAIVKAYGSYNDSEDLFFDEFGRYIS